MVTALSIAGDLSFNPETDSLTSKNGEKYNMLFLLMQVVGVAIVVLLWFCNTESLMYLTYQVNHSNSRVHMGMNFLTRYVILLHFYLNRNN